MWGCRRLLHGIQQRTSIAFAKVGHNTMSAVYSDAIANRRILFKCTNAPSFRTPAMLAVIENVPTFFVRARTLP